MTIQIRAGSHHLLIRAKECISATLSSLCHQRIQSMPPDVLGAVYSCFASTRKRKAVKQEINVRFYGGIAPCSTAVMGASANLDGHLQIDREQINLLTVFAFESD